MVCNPVPSGNEVYEGFIDDADFPIPDVSGINFPTLPGTDSSVFLDVPSVTLKDLTESKVNGSGVFDALMTSVTAHLDRERSEGRITNSDFAKSYVEFSTAAMSGAIQFLLQKDQAHWQALAAQTAAKLAIVQLAQAQVEFEAAKMQMQLIAFQAAQAKVAVAQGKMQLATARVEFCSAEYNLSDILPKQALNLTAQKSQTDAQTAQITATTNTLLPQQVRGATAQAIGQEYTNTNLLPQQLIQLQEGIKLVKEQYETQRAQTLDTRTDGNPVTGTLGKQKDVQTQQIQSYKQDAQLKAARPFIDAWITMKTIDEGTLPPTGFNNANLDQILALVRSNNQLV